MDSILMHIFGRVSEYSAEELDEMVEIRTKEAYGIAKEKMIQDFKDNTGYYGRTKDIYEPAGKIGRLRSRNMKPDTEILKMLEQYYEKQGSTCSNKFEICYLSEHNVGIDDMISGLKDNHIDFKEIHENHKDISVDKIFTKVMTRYNAAGIIIKHIACGVLGEDTVRQFRVTQHCYPCDITICSEDRVKIKETEIIGTYLEQLWAATELITKNKEKLKKGYREILQEHSSEIAFWDVDGIRRLEKLKAKIISTPS